jgi:hypothetical protein
MASATDPERFESLLQQADGVRPALLLPPQSQLF